MAKSKKDNPKHAAPIKDERFARLHSDPRFLRPHREAGKVVLDDRFKSLLTDDDGEGKKKKKMDKFGRKVKSQDSEKERMKKFYRIQDDSTDDKDDSEEDDEEGNEDGREEKAGFVDYARGGGELESSGDEDEDSSSNSDDDSDEESSEDSDDQDEVTVGRSAVRNREKKRLQQEEEDDEDSDLEVDLDEDDDEEEEEHDRAEKDSLTAAKSELSLDSKTTALLDAQAESAIRASREEEDQDQDEPSTSTSTKKLKKKSKRTRSAKEVPLGEDSNRLAVVNMDWDHLRALDLYKVFSSLVSPTAPPISTICKAKLNDKEDSNPRNNKQTSQVQGELFHVRVYPSDFGRERMEREDREGPPKDIFEGGRNGRNKKKKKKNRKNDSDLSDDEEDDDEPLVQVDDGEEFDVEKLRKYQLERLR